MHEPFKDCWILNTIVRVRLEDGGQKGEETHRWLNIVPSSMVLIVQEEKEKENFTNNIEILLKNLRIFRDSLGEVMKGKGT